MDTGALEGIVDEVIAAHPDEWEHFRTGDDKARGKLTGFFMGKVMQASQGQGRRQGRHRAPPLQGRRLTRHPRSARRRKPDVEESRNFEHWGTDMAERAMAGRSKRDGSRLAAIVMVSILSRGRTTASVW